MVFLSLSDVLHELSHSGLNNPDSSSESMSSFSSSKYLNKINQRLKHKTSFISSRTSPIQSHIRSSADIAFDGSIDPTRDKTLKCTPGTNACNGPVTYYYNRKAMRNNNNLNGFRNKTYTVLNIDDSDSDREKIEVYGDDGRMRRPFPPGNSRVKVEVGRLEPAGSDEDRTVKKRKSATTGGTSAQDPKDSDDISSESDESDTTDAEHESDYEYIVDEKNQVQRVKKDKGLNSNKPKKDKNLKKKKPLPPPVWVDIPVSKIGALKTAIDIKRKRGNSGFETAMEHNEYRRQACDGMSEPRLYAKIGVANIPFGNKVRGYRDWHHFDAGLRRKNGGIGDGYGCPKPKTKDSRIGDWVKAEMADDMPMFL